MRKEKTELIITDGHRLVTDGNGNVELEFYETPFGNYLQKIYKKLNEPTRIKEKKRKWK